MRFDKPSCAACGFLFSACGDLSAYAGGQLLGSMATVAGKSKQFVFEHGGVCTNVREGTTSLALPPFHAKLLGLLLPDTSHLWPSDCVSVYFIIIKLC